MARHSVSTHDRRSRRLAPILLGRRMALLHRASALVVVGIGALWWGAGCNSPVTADDLCGECPPSANGGGCYVPDQPSTFSCASYSPGCSATVPCAGGRICGPGNRCVESCNDASCDLAQPCSATSGLCEPKPCASTADCGKLLMCAKGVCARKSCSGDAECPGGLCYDQVCHASAPHCFACET